jgi:cell division topological specificity factor
MNLLSFFRRRDSAPVARERLQILLAHERSIVGGQSDLVAILREEIMAVIAKHIAVGDDQVQIKMDRGDSVSTLEVDIEIPTSTGAVRLAV